MASVHRNRDRPMPKEKVNHAKKTAPTRDAKRSSSPVFALMALVLAGLGGVAVYHFGNDFGQVWQVSMGIALAVIVVLLLLHAAQQSQRNRIEQELTEARDTALESVRLKAMFLANVSHELRTPMNGVIGMTGMLVETPLDERQLEYVETIRSCATSLVTIVNDLLDFSKLEVGKVRFERRDFDLKQTLASIMQLFSVQAQSKGVTLKHNVPSAVVTALRGDSGRLRQILSNLLSNAVKFTDHGQISLDVDRVSEDSKGVMLRFRVADTGNGISPEMQARLFQPFQRGDDQASRRSSGTGLGLVICKLLVEQMGGTIGVHSARGKGTAVEFTARFERAQSVRDPDADTPALRIGGDGMLLLISENHTRRKTIGLMLDAWDLAWRGFANAKAARAWIDTGQIPEQIRVLLVDHDRPEQAAATVSALLALPEVKNARSICVGPATELNSSTPFFAHLDRPLEQSALFDTLVAAWSARSIEKTQESVAAPSRPARIEAPGRVLIAEDNMVNQKVLVHMLESMGIQADTVSNGAQAVESCSWTNYVLVLMDCSMPIMDGYQATQEIRRLLGEDPPPVIIAVTAHAMEGDSDKCREAGMDDYLSKPIEPEQLRAKLEHWFEHLEQVLPKGVQTMSSPEAVRPTTSTPTRPRSQKLPPQPAPTRSQPLRPAPPRRRSQPLAPPSPPSQILPNPPSFSKRISQQMPPPLSPPAPHTQHREQIHENPAPSNFIPTAAPAPDQPPPQPALRFEVLDKTQYESVLPRQAKARAEFLAFALEDMENDYNAVQDAISTGDPEAIRKSAHKLQGVASTLGLKSLAAELATIEREPDSAQSGHEISLAVLWDQSRPFLDPAFMSDPGRNS